MSRRLLLLVPTTSYCTDAFTRAATRLDVELSIATESPAPFSQLRPDVFLHVDFHDLAAAANDVASFAERQPIDAVVAVDDQATLAAAAVAQRLKLPGNSVESVYATINKHRMRKLMQNRGVPTPEFQLLPVERTGASPDLNIDFPIVLKPLMMGASVGVIRVDSRAAFRDAFDRIAAIVASQPSWIPVEARTNVLVESYIDGWEVAVEGMVTNGHARIFSVYDKPDPLVGPYFPETIYVTPTRRTPSEQTGIECSVEETIAAIGLSHGPFHAELRGNDSGVFMVEIAARPIGGRCSNVLSFAGGVSLEEVILRHALDPSVVIPEVDDTAAGLMMLQSPTSGIYERIEGIEDALRVDGVTDVVVSAHPGKTIQALPEGSVYLGFIFAKGTSPGSVERSLREAAARINVVLN